MESRYIIDLKKENLIDSGNYGDVYKIYSKDKTKIYAAKFIKVNPDFMNSEEKLGYKRELEIMQ